MNMSYSLQTADGVRNSDYLEANHSTQLKTISILANVLPAFFLLKMLSAECALFVFILRLMHCLSMLVF